MSENWEYCLLHLYKMCDVNDKKKNKAGFRCGLDICYMGSTMTVKNLCAYGGERDENNRYYALVYPKNPWFVAIGILGSFGWELVSVKHRSYVDLTDGLHSPEDMAYFKRPFKKAGKQMNQSYQSRLNLNDGMILINPKDFY